MKRSNGIKYFFATLFIAISLYSCQSDGSCIKDTEVSLGVAFYQPQRDDEKQRLVVKPLSDTISVKGVEQDSALASGKSISSIRLPLKPFSTETSFIIQKDKKPQDTLIINHSNQEHFLSVECGVVIHHTVEKINFTRNSIDSITIIESKVRDNKSEAQVKIYFSID